MDHRKKTRKFQQNIYFCFIEYGKPFDYADHNELWKILNEMGMPDHLSCLLRELYRSRSNRLVQKWEKSMSRLYILSSSLFNLYAELD